MSQLVQGGLLVSSGMGQDAPETPKCIGRTLAPNVNSPRLRDPELDDVTDDVLFLHVLIRLIPLICHFLRFPILFTLRLVGILKITAVR